MEQGNVFLAGDVLAEPHFRFLPEGKPYLRFFVVTPRVESSVVDLIRVVAYGGLAETHSPTLRKGTVIAVHGQLQSRPYIHRATGQPRQQVEVVALRLAYPNSVIHQRTPNELKNVVSLNGKIVGALARSPDGQMLQFSITVINVEGSVGEIQIVRQGSQAAKKCAGLRPGTLVTIEGQLASSTYRDPLTSRRRGRVVVRARRINVEGPLGSAKE